MKRFFRPFLVALMIISWNQGMSTPQTQAIKIHNLLTGTLPSKIVLDVMTQMIAAGRKADAALFAIDHYGSSENPGEYNYFYSKTLPRFFKPWFSEESTIDGVILNDSIATLIGLTRDDIPFNQFLSRNTVYLIDRSKVGSSVRSYSRQSNNHYEDAEKNDVDLNKHLVAFPQTDPRLDTNQSLVNREGVPAGIYTTRGYASVYYNAGTNRTPVRFSLINFLCEDIEAFHDTTIFDGEVRRDVDREPGGDPNGFVNKCKGCHSGMDPLSRAFAYLDWNDTSKEMIFGKPRETTPSSEVICSDPEVILNENSTMDDKLRCAIRGKYKANRDSFPAGHIVANDQWKNYWTKGPNARIGWPAKNGQVLSGVGPKSLGTMIVNTRRFPKCMAQQVYKNICVKEDITSKQDENNINLLAIGFASERKFSMKKLFAEASTLCSGK